MTITALPGTRLLAVPVLDRDERERELQALAEDITAGLGPTPAMTDLIVRALCHATLEGPRAIAAWQQYLTACRRLNGHEAGEPLFGDPEPQMASADVGQALRVLLDGAH